MNLMELILMEKILLFMFFLTWETDIWFNFMLLLFFILLLHR